MTVYIAIDACQLVYGSSKEETALHLLLLEGIAQSGSLRKQICQKRGYVLLYRLDWLTIHGENLLEYEAISFGRSTQALLPSIYHIVSLILVLPSIYPLA